MKNFDNMLDRLKDSSGEMKGNIHMLNEIVPVEEQMKYFKYSQHIHDKKENGFLNRNYLIAKLFTPQIDIEDKRYYLSMLASIVDVSAYRAIETYHKSPMEPELSYWSALALAESKILLDAEFSGEQQYFVSTGLGGIDKKMRFFSVIATKSRSDFDDFERETIIRELQFQFDQNQIDVESIESRGNYIKILLLSGLNHDAKTCIQNAINEANQLGSFIDDNFLLTNVRQINDAEIEKLLNKDKVKKDGTEKKE